jgi:hypothetical protein
LNDFLDSQEERGSQGEEIDILALVKMLRFALFTAKRVSNFSSSNNFVDDLLGIFKQQDAAGFVETILGNVLDLQHEIRITRSATNAAGTIVRQDAERQTMIQLPMPKFSSPPSPPSSLSSLGTSFDHFIARLRPSRPAPPPKLPEANVQAMFDAFFKPPEETTQAGEGWRPKRLHPAPGTADVGVVREGTTFERFTETRQMAGNLDGVVGIHVKRFAAWGNRMVKLNNPLIFPPNGVLDISTAYGQPKGTIQGEVVSFVVHGGNLGGGHYVSYVKRGNQWYCCNDDRITEQTEAQIAEARKRAYLIFVGPKAK